MEMRKRSQRLLPPPFRRTPWLVFAHGKRMKYQIFCSITDQKMYIRSIPEMRRKFCWASCYGWLVMCDLNMTDLFLWNPVSLEKIQLPPLLSLKSIQYNCTLSSPPSDPNCRVFFFGEFDPLVFYCRPGDDKWTEEKCVVGENDSICVAISCNDKLYGSTYPRSRLVEISTVGDCLSTRVLEVEEPDFIPERPHLSRHMLESCGELFLVRIFYLLTSDVYEVGSIQVFRMDFSRMVWVKVDNLEDRVFFLCRKSPFSCSATELGLKRGSIYFNTGDGKLVYVFNVEDDSLSVSLPCSNLPTAYYFPTWVLPDLSLIDRQVENQREIEEEDDGREMQNMKAKEKEGLEKFGVVNTVANERHWSDLPHEILASIAQRLRLVDYLSFRGACREFRLVAPSIKWRTDSIGLETESLFPWLMFFKKDNGTCNFIDPWHNDTYCMNISELLLGAVIRFSKDGWLLMSRGKYFIFFFNPFTRAMIHLPDLCEEGFEFISICFSSLPTSSDCVVFGIGYGAIFLICKGDENWSRLGIDSKVFSPYANNPVFYNEGFYCLSKKGDIGVFEIKNEYVTWTVLDKPERPCTSIYQTFLAECDGELLSVFMGHMGKFTRVFRLNRSKMVWIEVKSLGNHMLFVSHTSSISAKAKTPEMANKIYFSRFQGESIVFYSLETRMYHSVGSEHSMSDFYDTKEQLHCGWIEPRWFETTEEELNGFGGIDTL
ncbi:hypothetical protein HHK36_031667 [Tetracentron sinense]|uniref:F-box domain-containing protein n=1 Tax=Tetracentron sinense TaxID=13715 RepID=A0A834YBQ7_TETSI|nr:hypothetical protein HHK36_031667 [Tetracentron sinense]